MSNEIWAEVIKLVNQWAPAIIGAWLGAHWSARKMRLLNNPAEKPQSKIQSLVIRIAKSIKNNWQMWLGFAFLATGYAREFWGPMGKLSIFLIVLYTVVLCVGLSAFISVKLITYAIRRLYAPEDKEQGPEGSPRTPEK